jgi:hypothetical protein
VTGEFDMVALGHTVRDGRTLMLRALRMVDPPARQAQPAIPRDGRANIRREVKPPRLAVLVGRVRPHAR